MASAADIVHEIASASALIAARDGSTGAAKLTESVVGAIVLKISRMPTLDMSGSLAITKALADNTMPNCVATSLQEAVDTRLATALLDATTAAPARGKVSQQLLTAWPLFLTGADWLGLESDASLETKVHIVVNRAIRLGIWSLHEQTVKYAVAVLLHVQFISKEGAGWPSYESIFNLVKDFKNTHYCCKSEYSYERLTTYPDTPEKLPEHVFTYAYDATDGPITKSLPRLPSILPYVVLRENNAFLVKERNHANGFRGGKAPSMDDRPTWGEMMDLFKNGFPHREAITESPASLTFLRGIRRSAAPDPAIAAGALALADSVADDQRPDGLQPSTELALRRSPSGLRGAPGTHMPGAATHDRAQGSQMPAGACAGGHDRAQGSQMPAGACAGGSLYTNTPPSMMGAAPTSRTAEPRSDAPMPSTAPGVSVLAPAAAAMRLAPGEPAPPTKRGGDPPSAEDYENNMFAALKARKRMKDKTKPEAAASNGANADADTPGAGSKGAKGKPKHTAGAKGAKGAPKKKAPPVPDVKLDAALTKKIQQSVAAERKKHKGTIILGFKWAMYHKWNSHMGLPKAKALAAAKIAFRYSGTVW